MPIDQQALQIAHSLHQQGKIEEALKRYQELNARYPLEIVIIQSLCLAHVQLGQLSTAKSLLKKAIKELPNEASLYNSLGNIFVREDKITAAIKAYCKAVELTPSYASALSNLGNCYLRQGDNQKAKYYYKEAIRINPNFADPYYNLARLLLAKEKKEEAVSALLNVIKIAPDHIPALAQLGKSLLEQENYTDALRYITQWHTLEPQNVEAEHALALTHLKLNNYAEAVSHFSHALELNADLPEGEFHLATAYFLQGQRSLALSHYLRQVTRAPHLDSLYNIGVILADQNRFQEAIDYFQQVINLDPTHLKTHQNIAAVYLKMHNENKAIQHYQIAAKLEPQNSEIQYILHALTQDSLPARAPQEYTAHLFNAYASSYDHHLLQYLKYDVPSQLHKLLISELNPTDHSLKILDLGCGTGLIGEKFALQAKELVGIDLSAAMLTIAQSKNLYHSLENSDIIDALKKHRNYDLVVAADTIPYFGDLSQVFAHTHKALKTGGHFAFSIERSAEKSYILQKTMRYAHSKTYIKSLASDYSFEIISCSNTILRLQEGNPVEGYLYLIKSL